MNNKINITSGGKILVVDDSEDMLEVLRRNLNLKGYKTFTVTNVGDAIKMLESTPVDLVITDLKMPGVGGIELIKHIRANYKNIEVLVITGYPSIQGASSGSFPSDGPARPGGGGQCRRHSLESYRCVRDGSDL